MNGWPKLAAEGTGGGADGDNVAARVQAGDGTTGADGQAAGNISAADQAAPGRAAADGRSAAGISAVTAQPEGSSGKMSPEAAAVLEAIASRRSIGRVKDEPVAREVIRQLLEAASWAPSHHNTQPWRFVVMTGEGRGKLAEGYASVAAAESPGLEGGALEEKLRKERAKAYRAPVVIAAICSPSNDPRAVYAEEFAAVQTSVQNLLLAAHALGLGAIWRSGAPMYHPRMKETFELRPDEEIVAFIYLGYPGMKPLQPKRSPIPDKTVWLDA